MPTRVINTHNYDGPITIPATFYCGRDYLGNVPLSGYGMFGNPIVKFHKCRVCGKIHQKAGDTLPCYSIYLEERLQDPVFSSEFLKLEGMILRCFCRPKDGFKGRVLCHCQIMAAKLDGCRSEDIE
jgi:hypothetical protein